MEGRKPDFKKGIQTGSSNVPGRFLSQTGKQPDSQSAYFRDSPKHLATELEQVSGEASRARDVVCPSRPYQKHLRSFSMLWAGQRLADKTFQGL